MMLKMGMMDCHCSGVLIPELANAAADPLDAGVDRIQLLTLDVGAGPDITDKQIYHSNRNHRTI